MIKNIIREVAPEACDFRTYFDDDGLTRAAGAYCYTLFIVSNEGWGRISGFNIDEYGVRFNAGSTIFLTASRT